ncbi:hypothetical protein CBR_g51043 [Chara braunii]|uniref:Myb-like domain-containing protein n=1 Tax=Chara braunii TaxID=69332 RepID=A0A388K5W6_CHABU|nr:hypothetical protein CBR_g51043 [Chara braunii]|eukprot:GBG65448.1 hypothetical protein CBR_g51043 [Chara braunii]
MADVFRKLPVLLLVVLLLLLLVVFHMCILGNVLRRRSKRRSSMKDGRTEARQAIAKSGGEQVGGRRCGGSPLTVGRASQRVGYEALPPHLQPLPGSSDEEEERRPRTSFTELLRPGLSGDEGDGRVNLSFGLSTGRSSTPSRKGLVYPYPDDDGGQLTVVDRSSNTRALARETTGANPNSSTQQARAPSLSRAAQGRPHWMLSPSPLSAASEVPCPRGGSIDAETNFFDVGDGRDAREVWKEHRWELQARREESITRGVEHLRVGDREKEKDSPPPEADDDNEDDNDGKGGQGKGSGGDGDGDAEEKRNFWSVEHIIALIRAKRDQDAHMQGMGHAYARMKPREWKWQDVAQRLKNVGVDRDAEKCGKKWDNLMQQFKKVHHFQSPSGGGDFFQLSSKERASKGFNLTMDRAVYDEIEGSPGMNHTIHPKNVSDTGASGGVRLPSTSNADPESVADGDGGAGREDDDEGSTGGSSQTTGAPADFGKRKSTRQQTFDALTECMEKHGALMASTMESASKRQCSIQVRQCEALEAEVEVQRKHYAASGEVNKLMCHALLEIAKAICSTRDVNEEVVEEHEIIHEDDDFEEEEEQPLKRKPRASSGGGIKINEGGDETPSARRGGGGVTGGHADFVDVERDVPRREIGGRVKEGVVAHESAQCAQTPSKRLNTPPVDVAGSSQAAVQGGALRSPSTVPRGGAVTVAGEAGEVPKAGDDGVVAEDDEALVHRLRGALGTTEAIDGGHVSYERLKAMAEAMRYLLAATMWIIRMAGDDPRSHYDAWVFVQLSEKTTLLASMNRQFDARRHITQAAQVMTDKLGRPPPTFAPPPVYIPDWVSKCGVTFSHDATLASPMEAKRLDWLGTGPPEGCDEDDDGVDKGQGG